MFGSTKNSDTSKPNTTTLAPGSGLNAFVKGTTVEGNVRCDTDMRVDGAIKGNLSCKAKVIVGPTGSVEGEIQCQNAVIEGKFKGKLRVSELLNIRETADVQGEVNTAKLIVQSGARFNAGCSMDNNKVNSNGAGTTPTNNNDSSKIATGKTTVNN
jgi:cytoskeletal protein CcmA (bactofilin family)